VAKKQKLKTHKATAKRFRVTGTGKVLRTKGPKSHLRRRKSKRAKAKLSKMVVVNKTISKRIMTLAPHLKRHKSNPPG
jgi:large subunit ribosomal protein L35